MGTWGTKIDENDVFADVYAVFFETYNEGTTSKTASGFVQKELSHYFADKDDKFDAIFALAFALWETQSLDKNILAIVEQLIISDQALQNWRDREASESDIELRTKHLTDFLTKLRVPRKSKKRRRKQKVDITTKLIVAPMSPDGAKTLKVQELYVNNEYHTTNGSMHWANGGGGVFQFILKGVGVSAKWIDASNLNVEFTHGDIEFQQKEDSLFFSGDTVYFHYEFSSP